MTTLKRLLFFCMIRKRVTNIRYNCMIAMSIEYQLNDFVHV